MITIKNYKKPKTVAEAYELLLSSKNNTIIGSGAFLRLGSKKIETAVDLSNIELDYIKETDKGIEIGAMTTFGDLGRSSLLKKYYYGIIPMTISNIVGIQMRNLITVGGTVYGRLGFSELITCLLALDCNVVLHKNGEMSLNDFLEMKGKGRDILEKIILKKKDGNAGYKMLRNTSGSIPILAAAASRCGADYRIAVGARPAVAKLATKAMDFMQNQKISVDVIEKAADIASSELVFSDDRRASKEYRKEICRVLVKRSLVEVEK